MLHLHLPSRFALRRGQHLPGKVDRPQSQLDSYLRNCESHSQAGLARVSQNHSHSIIHSSLYWKAQSRPLPLLSSSPTMNVAVVQNCANGAQMTQPCLTSLLRDVISILLHLICTFYRSHNSNLRRGWLAGWSSAWESQTDQVSHPRPHLHNLHRWVFVFDNGDVFVFAC